MSRQNLATAIGLLMLGGFHLPAAECQQPKPALVQPVPRHVVWDGIFGSSRNAPETTYCLMGSGFIQAPTSANLGNLVSHWISIHPEAKITPVMSCGPVTVKQPKSKLIYVWVVDGKDSLNEYLVRQGGCPGDTMQIPDTSYYPQGAVGRTFFKLLIPQQNYARVIKSIARAEAEAQKEKLGIWKHGTNID